LKPKIATLTPVAYAVAAAGDHALTGLAIGRMLGIAGNGTVITGGPMHQLNCQHNALARGDYTAHTAAA
jgi:hypothetical protein